MASQCSVSSTMLQSYLALRIDLIECCHSMKLELFFSIVCGDIVLIAEMRSQQCVAVLCGVVVVFSAFSVGL